jgi:anaerobic magnesium-protoporphyrin IX monomethyl ester cyclase
MAKIVLIAFNKYVLALRGISSYLKANGHDTMMFFFTSYLNKELLNDVNKKIRDFAPDLIGLSLVTDEFNKAKALTYMLKEEFDSPVVWGGPHVSVSPNECLEFADVIFKGEVEIPILELCKRIEEKRDYSDVKGIGYKKEGKMIVNPVGELLNDLNSLPFPDYDTETHYYVGREKITKFNDRLKEYGMMSSRGCPYTCNFCYNSYSINDYGKNKWLRMMSIERTLDELKWAKKKFKGLKRINFYDDNFLLRNANDMRKFAEGYKKDVKLPFFAEGHPDLINEETIKILKDAGLVEVQLGIQSGSERVNDEEYDRRTTKKQILEAVKTLQKYKVKVWCDIIFNNPYETVEEVKETAEFLLTLPKPYVIHGFNLIYYPGTTLTKRVLDDGLVEPLNGEKLSESIEHISNSPLFSFNKAVQSERFYKIKYDSKDKAYYNAVIGLIQHYPKGVIRILLKSENVRLLNLLIKPTKYTSFVKNSFRRFGNLVDSAKGYS